MKKIMLLMILLTSKNIFSQKDQDKMLLNFYLQKIKDLDAAIGLINESMDIQYLARQLHGKAQTEMIDFEKELHDSTNLILCNLSKNIFKYIEKLRESEPIDLKEIKNTNIIKNYKDRECI